MIELTNFSYGEGKRKQILASFGQADDNLEKGMGKLDTSHLVLKEISVGGKMVHRWIDPTKGNKEYAGHGSKIEFDHKGEKKTGTIGGVLKTGEYSVKGDDGKSYAKHPHQFNSPHSVKEGDVVDKEPTKRTPEDHAAETDSAKLKAYASKKDADPSLAEVAKKELKGRGESAETEETGDKKTSGADKAAKTGKGAETTSDGKKVSSEKDVKELDSEFDDEDINQKFKSYEKIVRMVAKGLLKSGIAYGTGGVGKTFTAMQQLKKMVNPKTGKPFVFFDPKVHEAGSSDYDVVKITGKATTAGVYKALYEHNGKMLFFDDCDAVLKDENSINMFKGALDSTGDGEISNLSARPIKDSTGAAIPDSYKFNGRAMFISNLSAKDLPQPIKSRSVRIDLSMNASQTIDRIKEIAKDKQGKFTNIELQDTDGNNIKYDHKDMDEAIKFLEKYKDKTTDLNIRTLGNIVRVIHDHHEEGEEGDDWKMLARSFLLSKGLENETEVLDNPVIAEPMNEIEKAFQDLLGDIIIKSEEVEEPILEDKPIDEIEKAFQSLLSK